MAAVAFWDVTQLCFFVLGVFLGEGWCGVVFLCVREKLQGGVLERMFFLAIYGLWKFISGINGTSD